MGLDHLNANGIPGRGITAAIAAGCLVAFIGFGFSAAFGIFLRPMSEELGWPRETFSLSLGLQALFWGFIQPFAGMIADRYGTGRVLAFGAVVSAFGFCLRGTFVDPAVFVATGVVVGVGTGACSFPVVIVALGKIVEERRRSFILGLGTAAGIGRHVRRCTGRDCPDRCRRMAECDSGGRGELPRDPASAVLHCSGLAPVGTSRQRWWIHAGHRNSLF